MSDTKGITLPCPRCLEEDCGITLNLEDGELSCLSCGEDFTVEQVEVLIARWGAVLDWINARPIQE